MEISRRIAEIQEGQRFQETKKAERAETQLPRYCLSERLTDFVISSNTYSDLVVEKTRIEEIIELVEYFILEKRSISARGIAIRRILIYAIII